MIVRAEFLAPQLPLVACHILSPRVPLLRDLLREGWVWDAKLNHSVGSISEYEFCLA
jgi:hypothetical protein